MVSSLYQQDTQAGLHRGAIYRYCPIFWLEPPLWVLRNAQWTSPRSATIHRREELRDAFARTGEDNQEDVIARAKVRFVVILSSDSESTSSRFKEVIVAPTYSIDPTRHSPSFLERLRNSQYPDLHYVAEDPNYPQMGECYVDFRRVQSLHKGFLLEGKLHVAFTPDAIKAILFRYKQYL